MNYLLSIAYDGSGFCGWQRLPNARTVQGVIEQALTKMLRETITIDGAGRTDAGVHALNQTATFQTTKPITAEQLAYALNHFLPSDISIEKVNAAADDFHARYSAVGKRYGYKLFISPVQRPFQERYESRIKEALDEGRVREAMCYFCGRHDFKALMASGSHVKDTIRTISKFELDRQGDSWYFGIEGDGFLYHMVRIIIGTLIDIGRGRIEPNQVPMIIESGQRHMAKRTAPANGLYLENVFYDV
ncbi:tRNA pseudouridine(38-40) synthase TruA [Fusibacter paucivorans]|uniref:tRNA pseudouridine synthase A n=1 Tax=Fusibacter paucivorans TaxID=76009 RepID=A0ABS5PTF3_9FIRM|nr:tRNA pseudouridine(38-40) synthase TruA [Fusibacter paucivorans]MBS7528192.1 tRNA pseudouridine(38-40) synthase TruA [Fusibacter paucivorans]